jgi:tetratricopeptide (TPR) repeat protein
VIVTWVAVAAILLGQDARRTAQDPHVARLLEAHRVRPDDPALCQQIGIAYTQSQEFAKAAEYFRKALAIDPRLLPARKNLATVLWFLDRKGESEREFRELAKERPEDPVPQLYLGLAEFERKRFAAAKLHFRSAGELAMDNPEVLPAVLETFLATKDAGGTAELLGKVPRANPDLAVRAAAVLHRYGEHERSTAILEQALDPARPRPDALLLLADSYDKAQQPERAYDAYSAAIKADPANEQAYLGVAQFASAHRNAQFAHEVLGRGLERLPGSAKLRLQQGILWALEGDRARAEKSFAAAAAADPKWNVPVLAIGLLRLEEGAAAQAAEVFQRAAAIAPNDYRAQYLYADALRRAGASGGTRGEIVSALRKALMLNPNHAASRALLGQEHIAAGNLEAGIAELEKAVRVEPANTTALYQLGMAYQRQGRTADSRRVLQAFREAKAKARDEETAIVQILKIVGQKAP